MKRLVYLFIATFHLIASAQSFHVRNANEDYTVTSLNDFNISNKSLREIIRDKNGLYWFQGVTELLSFDGVHWKTYKLRSAGIKSAPFRLNDIEVTDDNTIWVATEDGIYIFDPRKEVFIPVKQIFPEIKGFPLAVSSMCQIASDKLVFVSQHQEGFYLVEWKEKKLQHIVIDTIIRALVSAVGIATDKKENLWGLTTDGNGIWNYNLSTGKVLCSWKGELSQFSGKSYQYLADLSYSENDKALWISHGTKGYVEKLYLQTGKSIFYSFSGKLNVHTDTNSRNKYKVARIKIDKNENGWVRVNEKYLVKLSSDINRLEYLVSDPNTFPIEELKWFVPEIRRSNRNENNILFWSAGIDKIFMIKKKKNMVRHIPFDTLSVSGIRPDDYINADERQNIFFEKGKDGQYFLMMQNEGRPKLICFDNNFHLTKVLFNDQWRQYPAFFNQAFNPDTFYIAIMRPGIEPLDFRTVVLKDFKVDLGTFKVTEMTLDFKHRVWRYGSADADNVYWLFSNGSLYSYDPQKDVLDSIYISKPDAKGSFRLEFVKGYDYPTLLHKESSTFWIDFVPVKELYKINLKMRKVDKVFKCCMDQKDCIIPGGIYDMYNFDADRIYLQLSFSPMLLNTKSDSLIDYSDLFQKNLVAQNPTGSGVYKDWIYMVFPTHIYFLNTVTSKQKELVLNEDFKWRISQFNSGPLINDRGEMILMSSAKKGFLVFNIDSVLPSEKPGTVQLSFIKLDNRNLGLDSLMKMRKLSLKYNKYNSIQIGFSDHSVYDAEKINYEYTMYKGGDTLWNKIEGKPELTFSDLSSGRYQLLLRASNVFGDYSEKINSFSITILPPFWQTWWFRGLVIMTVGLFFYVLYRYRIYQMQRLQTVRNNIASDLHDDIGSTLNSISIYSEVAKQQAGKEIPALDLIGQNSRKIIESMSDIVWAINPENDSFEKIIVRMRSIAYQLLKAKKVEYTFEVDERLNSIALPMQVRKNFYLVFKEAINNLVKYSGADRVAISLIEENKNIVLKIRDNGIGIPVNPETMGNGMLNMKRRAEEIQAILKIDSVKNGGTGIEMILKT